MNVRALMLSILLLVTPMPVQAEIPPSIPITAKFEVVAIVESDVARIFFVCELYTETLTTTTVFFKICRVKDSGRSVVQITFYEQHFEEVIVWAAEGFTVP